ncbi:hypothetical protein GCM10022254_76190 [Actinomadura meridiana]|uniref:Uncharacterized protein n=1 Tax=Actinomadura meridiana TaxID=559626 RepID=A0ABP8CRN4_9ACTN
MDTNAAEQYLSELAGELDPETFRTQLIRAAGDWPELTVTNRKAARLSERVKVLEGYYQWSWGQTIAPVGERAVAARRVSRVLAIVEG